MSTGRLKHPRDDNRPTRSMTLHRRNMLVRLKQSTCDNMPTGRQDTTKGVGQNANPRKTGVSWANNNEVNKLVLT